MVRRYKLNNSCTTYVVYPSKKKEKKPVVRTLIGQKVYSRNLGWGTIVSDNRGLCTIRYAERKVQCYTDDEKKLVEATKEYLSSK